MRDGAGYLHHVRRSTCAGATNHAAKRCRTIAMTEFLGRTRVPTKCYDGAPDWV